MNMSQTLKKDEEKSNNQETKGLVYHPIHYNQGIEMWDYAYTHNLDFFEGNIVKYVTRWKHKNGLQDLLKAKEYLDKLIQNEQKKTTQVKSSRQLGQLKL